MALTVPKDRSLERLQPEFADKVRQMMNLLQQRDPSRKWAIYESYRPPRDSGGHTAVSKTNPAVNPSLHGYGAAVDVLPFGRWGGAWNSGKWEGWDVLLQAAQDVGLDAPLDGKRSEFVDRAHVQVPRSQLVRWLQSDLGVSVDGIWGPETDAAARAAAKNAGLQWREPTPTMGAKIHPKTYNQLRRRISPGLDNVVDATRGAVVVAGIFIAYQAARWVWQRFG